MVSKIIHGARYTYVWHACRCKLCIASNTLYQQNRRKALKERANPDEKTTQNIQAITETSQQLQAEGQVPMAPYK